jgi:glutamine synthetase
VLCDFVHENGDMVLEAPRSVLRRQLDLLAKKGLTSFFASELEFFLFNNSFHDAFASEYRNLTPSSDYRIDYHTMQPARDEALMRQVRNQMCAAGVPVENSGGPGTRDGHWRESVFSNELMLPSATVTIRIC